MKKNDITYEYRVFTNRLVDVGSMEVGNCTSKVLENLKSKDKVDGRFFHTSDKDEWFFCWNGELQKLNLKGDADVNSALAEVEKLIADAKVAVEDAKKTASEAKDAAASAKDAADAATSAVESIENKADKSVVEELVNEVSNKADVSVVEELSNTIEAKADKSVVEELSNTIEVKADKSVVDEKADKSVVEELSQKVNEIPSVEEIALKSEIPSMDEYITEEELSGKSFATTEYVGQQIANIEIPTVPTNISEFTNDAGYLTEHQDISGKQDVITDLETIRTGAAAGATALQTIPEEYVTETELNNKGYLTEQSLNGYATESFVSEEIKKIVIPNMDDYYTKGDIDTMIGNINTMIGQATEITNTILNA